jgi:UDP-glucose 4-epimerase|tara:strand:+ start:728 stop:1624 length:897 start_codon:yes stop_codon:yes gene_type:complete
MRKKIVVFGGSGFLGRYFCEEILLTNSNINLINYDLKKINVKSKFYQFVKGDIQDKEKINRVLKNAEFVFNFAGISDIEECQNDPIKSANINIIGNLNILNSCVKNKIKKIFFASSLYSFSDQGSFYKCSKQSSEIYLMEFKKLYNLDYVILRYGSVYGEDCSINNGLYKILKNLIIKKKLLYSGSEKTERSYIHVRDVAKITIKILKSNTKNCVYLIKGSKNIKIYNLLNFIKKIMNVNYKVSFQKNKLIAHYIKYPDKFVEPIIKKIKFEEKILLEQGLISLNNYMKQKYKKFGKI